MVMGWLAACDGSKSPPRQTPGHTAAESPAPHSAAEADHTAVLAHSATHSAPDPLPTFREPGPFTFTTQDLTSAATSCPDQEVWVYTPDGGPGTDVVVVAHGFGGRRGDMVGWGEHLASWGFTALVPSMCHARPLDVDHRQNGLDLVALAADQAPGQVPWYVGYSAGGLAALVAATEDPAAGGHLGLDMVDAFGIGAGAAPSLAVPAADLFAEPSACNSRNNGVPLYDGQGVPTIGVPGADHCDWMNPPLPACDLVCATGPDEPRIREAITTLATSWLLWQSGLEPGAAAWWTPGSEGYDTLLADGWITP